MKKTLNINIGNSIIHIEEDACELLNSYLIEVKQHFGKSADDFEIVSDIENRIAEMFTEMLHTQQKQVIELADVQVVIELMGSVKDFEEESDDEPSAGYTNAGYAGFGERKIYRDTEEAMVAGVCSGLSHYLRMDVSILRVLAVLSVLLGGSGLIAYLILWVSIPKAYTRSERMAMKGEAVNLQGFKRNFEEELSNLKENFRSAGDQMRPFVKHSGSFIAEFIEVLGAFMQGAGKTIFKFIAIIIMISGSLMMVSALIVLAALLGLWDSGTSGIFPLNIVDEAYFTTFVIAVFIVVAIPLLSLILLSVRVAFNSRSVNRMFSYALLLIWLCGLAVGIFYVAKITTEFKEDAEFTQNIPIKSFPVYTLSLDRSRFFSKDDSLRYQLNSAEYTGKIIQTDDRGPFNQPRNVTVRIEKSDDSSPSLTESYSAKGINFETALYHAKNIHYDFMQQDSLLKFGPELHLMKNVNWRDQQIELVLKVPVGAVLKIDRDLDRYLQGYSLWDCGDDHSGDAPYEGVMTEEGLKCKFDQ
ncbi:PspC domain-containing protein [Pedobacter hartonius]|uniref:Phage shock protein C (PspC) family protein n=1 Tax=Pedobacter hartonius TaxID=425514 RepID=A0A1H3Z1L1_9SPHI|nr:PspC domain-containing protein [Pedobacter hartonius]SEA17321.1 phage shock protein C (PspC) family protein [Pedobacter hartonius]